MSRQEETREQRAMGRQIRAHELRAEGHTYAEIARRMGVSAGRVREIVSAGSERARFAASGNPLARLSTRALHALKNADVSDVPGFLALNRKTLSGIPNLGKRSIEEIEKLQQELSRGTWERVTEGTHRLAVPGGWLYRYTCIGSYGAMEGNETGAALCFVPNPPGGG